MPSLPEIKECMACYDILNNENMPSCGHELCGKCIQKIFQWAIDSQSNYPPLCITHDLNLEHVEHLLTPPMIEEFKKKRVEYNDGNRIYCCIRACSTYLSYDDRDREAGIATCSKCGAKTCLECKKNAHQGDCDVEVVEDVEELMSIASQKKWQICRGCRQMVELREGCGHVTCVCGRQFCYKCGGDYGRCECILHAGLGEHVTLDARLAQVLSGIALDVFQDDSDEKQE